MDLKKHTNAFCEDCGSEKQYSKKYDAFYCELCNRWLEEQCGDSNCEFCQNRPKKPSMVDES